MNNNFEYSRFETTEYYLLTYGDFRLYCCRADPAAERFCVFTDMVKGARHLEKGLFIHVLVDHIKSKIDEGT